ncbi:MAG: glycosyltransferase family 4 protein [Hyphomonadaceae bacterium]|nr:glycosyltransferase family 4 protein [Hyphomonadaceae bacterium]
MNVLVYTAFYKPGYKGGGPIKTVSNLIEATGDEVNYHVVTGDRDLGDDRPYVGIELDKWCRRGKASVFYGSKTLLGRLRALLCCVSNRYDVVYLNSFFDSFFSIFPLILAKIVGKRMILGPRGEFSAGALALKSKKKQVFIRLYKILRLHRHVVFQASSEYEGADIKRVLGADVEVFVAEDIGLLERPISIGNKDSDRLRLVFVSRISAMKNLLFALEILRGVRGDFVFDIFGPIEDHAYWECCKEVIAKLPPNVKVRYCGELRPDEVLDMLAGYDLFFFPTKGENYGHVITEAFCAGLPVLISDATPWRGLESEGVGWDLSLEDSSQFVAVLEAAARMSGNDYREFRQGVLNWAERRFSGSLAIEANLEMLRYTSRDC